MLAIVTFHTLAKTAVRSQMARRAYKLAKNTLHIAQLMGMHMETDS